MRRNEIVLLLVDRPMPGEGVPVQFFGETAWLPSGPAAIALKTGASIVIGHCIRLPGDVRFAGGLEPALDYAPLLTGDKEADVRAITQAVASAMETLIRRAPDQWYMFRPMWPRPATARELRRAAHPHRRHRGRRLVHGIVGARHSIGRLRARMRRGSDVAGTALGISVDPAIIEEWVEQGPEES